MHGGRTQAADAIVDGPSSAVLGDQGFTIHPGPLRMCGHPIMSTLFDAVFFGFGVELHFGEPPTDRDRSTISKSVTEMQVCRGVTEGRLMSVGGLLGVVSG